MFPIPGLRVKLFYWSQAGKDVEGQKKAEGLACWWVRFDLIFLFPARCLPPSSQLADISWSRFLPVQFLQIVNLFGQSGRGGNYTSVWFDEEG